MLAGWLGHSMYLLTVTQFRALQRTPNNNSSISDNSDFFWVAFRAMVGLSPAMCLEKCMTGKQVSGQHTLEEEQDVIMDSFVEPGM